MDILKQTKRIAQRVQRKAQKSRGAKSTLLQVVGHRSQATSF